MAYNRYLAKLVLGQPDRVLVDDNLVAKRDLLYDPDPAEPTALE